jgi:enterochelin esterase-like enzyme
LCGTASVGPDYELRITSYLCSGLLSSPVRHDYCIIFAMPHYRDEATDEATDEEHDEQRGSVLSRRPIDPRARRITIQSAALGVDKNFYVALPPGYSSAANNRERYPTLYLFRGHEREWVHRQQDHSRHGRTVIDVYRDLLEDGKVGPLILVFPGTSSDNNRIPGLLVNFREPELTRDEPGIGTGQFEDYFVRELVPYIDANFRTIPRREARAVDGFSLGGFQSIKIAAQHPELFCSAGSFDGTFLWATNQGRGVRVRDRVLNNAMFDAAFGRPRDLDHVATNSPANLIATANWSALAGVQWLIRSGPKEAEPWQSNYYRAQHVIDLLAARNIENAVEAVEGEATHNWHWADRHIATTLPLHWQAMVHAWSEDYGGPIELAMSRAAGA